MIAKANQKQRIVSLYGTRAACGQHQGAIWQSTAENLTPFSNGALRVLVSATTAAAAGADGRVGVVAFPHNLA